MSFERRDLSDTASELKRAMKALASTRGMGMKLYMALSIAYDLATWELERLDGVNEDRDFFIRESSDE